MFLFNRTASSTDAIETYRNPSFLSHPVSRHRNLTTASEASTFEGMEPAGNFLPQSDSRKRSSVFGGRSKSRRGRADSTSYLDGGHAVNETVISVGVGPGGHAHEEFKPESSSKWFFGRPHKKLRQHSSKHSLPTISTTSLNSSLSADPEVPRLYTDRHRLDGRSRSSSYSVALNNCKRTISRPYNFQHVTHTDSRQFPDLDRTSHNELASEFSAVRASQEPLRELRGISAHDISRKRLRPSDKRSSSSYSERAGDFSRHDTPSPADSQYTLGHNATESTSSNHRLSVRPQGANSLILPPPRTSSRQAVTLSFDQTVTDNPSDRSIRSHHQGGQASIDGLMLPPQSLSPDLDDTPHAVTTPDDTAWHLKPPSFSNTAAGLADVPEEEENINSNRGSRRSSRPASFAPPLRHTQSLGDMQKILSATESQNDRPKSAVFETPQSPIQPTSFDAAEFADGPSRLSLSLNSIEGCWEDDIDYCYDHAAEADCEYDWDKRSEDERDTASVSAFGAARLRPSEDSKNATSVKIEEELVNDVDSASPLVARSRNSFFRPSLLVPAYSPSVGPKSAESAISESTIASELPTPLSPRNAVGFGRPISYASTVFKESDGFNLSPSLLIPPDFRSHMFPEAHFDDCASEEQIFSLYGNTQSSEISRSSLVQRSSQENMVPSRTSSIAKHRASNSGGSVPDLIPSRRAREGTESPSRRGVKEEFDFAAEQLAGHIANLSTASSGGAKGNKPSAIQFGHNRSRSLAKDVAQQSILRKAASSGNILGAALSHSASTASNSSFSSNSTLSSMSNDEDSSGTACNPLASNPPPAESVSMDEETSITIPRRLSSRHKSTWDLATDRTKISNQAYPRTVIGVTNSITVSSIPLPVRPAPTAPPASESSRLPQPKRATPQHSPHSSIDSPSSPTLPHGTRIPVRSGSISRAGSNTGLQRTRSHSEAAAKVFAGTVAPVVLRRTRAGSAVARGPTSRGSALKTCA